MKVLITGGAGFIGSNLIHYLSAHSDWPIVNVDKLTYAANLDSLVGIDGNRRACFERADICDAARLRDIFETHQPDAVMHLAAETHVDRSIDAPAAFIQSNVIGTYTLLEAALDYWRGLDAAAAERFRFLHVSTDEVFGSCTPEGHFTETSPYRPNSPYSASKAAADHLVRAWQRTYGLPVLISNCSNNYGPYQFPEKLIPLTILNAIAGKPLPVYGTGQNVRDWVFVEDYAAALVSILGHGRIGESYNVGGDVEMTNIAVVRRICAILDERLPESPHHPHADLIEFVADRPGHDLRYAMDSGKVEAELGWRPTVDFDTGLYRTVEWYLAHGNWWEPLLRERYGGERLGLGANKA